MANPKIRKFKGSDLVPETTVTVPGGVLRIASKLIPKQAIEALQEEGIDLEEIIIRLSENPEANGTLVDVEDHKKHERVVISLE
jgi:aspartokinase